MNAIKIAALFTLSNVYLALGFRITPRRIIRPQGIYPTRAVPEYFDTVVIGAGVG
jgi:hypothetical protein